MSLASSSNSPSANAITWVEPGSSSQREDTPILRPTAGQVAVAPMVGTRFYLIARIVGITIYHDLRRFSRERSHTEAGHVRRQVCPTSILRVFRAPIAPSAAADARDSESARAFASRAGRVLVPPRCSQVRSNPRCVPLRPSRYAHWIFLPSTQ